MAATATAGLAVAHLGSQSNLLSLQQATRSYRELPDEFLPVQALQDVAAAGVSGRASSPCGAAELKAAQQQYRVRPFAAVEMMWGHNIS